MKRGLGRGLDSLFGEYEEESQEKKEVVKVDQDFYQLNQFQFLLLINIGYKII